MSNAEVLEESIGRPSIRTGERERIAFGMSAGTGSVGLRLSDDEALQLVHRVFLLQAATRPQVVTFAGVGHGVGCSQVCASVAEILAKDARRPVCIVEGNLRTPALAGIFGTSNRHGLKEALSGEGEILSYAKKLPGKDNLWLLSSGSVNAASPGLLTSVFLGERIKQLRAEFEFILIDSPPLAEYGDAIALGQVADGLVMVLEASSTHREVAAESLANLRSSKVNVLAAVLNKTV